MHTIKVIPNFYASTINAPQAHLLTVSDDRTIAYWETETEAQKVIDTLESGTYYLKHGEVERPEYSIVKNGDYGRDCIKGNYSNEIQKSEIDPRIFKQLQDSFVDFEREYNAEYDTYSYYVEEDNFNYGIVFTVSVIAIQLTEGDLSYLTWDSETYVKEEL